MAIITGRQDIALGTTNSNILQGSPFEFLRANSMVKMGCIAEFGVNLPGDLRATFQIGDAIVASGIPVPYEKALGQGVAADTDLLYVDIGQAGQRLTLSVTNGGAANQEFGWYVLIA